VRAADPSGDATRPARAGRLNLARRSLAPHAARGLIALALLVAVASLALAAGGALREYDPRPVPPIEIDDGSEERRTERAAKRSRATRERRARKRSGERATRREGGTPAAPVGPTPQVAPPSGGDDGSAGSETGRFTPQRPRPAPAPVPAPAPTPAPPPAPAPLPAPSPPPADEDEDDDDDGYDDGDDDDEDGDD